MWFTVQIPWLVFSMSSTLRLVAITVFFVFHRKCFLWSSCICVYSSYVQGKLSKKPFIFIFLQNERKFQPKFATILVKLRDNLVLPVKIVGATGGKKAFYFHDKYHGLLYLHGRLYCIFMLKIVGWKLKGIARVSIR